MITTRLLAPAVGAASILAGVLAALTASVAAADPAPPIPFIPAVPAPLPAVPGSYTYSYYNFPAVAPAASTNADPAATAAGLPGSKLGNAAHPPNIQTSSSTRYGIAGGVRPASAPSTTGVQFAAGNENPALEDPYGRPPQSIAGTEAVAPTVMPGAPTPPVPPRLPSGPDASRSDHIPGRGI